MGAEWIQDGRGADETQFAIERDLVCTTDAAGAFTALNAAWERVLGWSRQELMARPFIEFVHPEDVERTLEVASKVTQPDYELVNFENRYRTKAGDWRWLRWSARSDGQMWFALAWDVTERREAEERLSGALTEDRLLAYTQPIVDRDGRMGQEELLVRLRADGNGTVLEPREFLPDAERYGLVRVVDRWMVEQAIGVAASGRCAEVNLSARSIVDQDLATELEAALRAVPEAASRLIFEITETAAIEHFDAASDFVARMSRLGCRFALDDFGTGFGCFTYLRRLRVQFLKIDASFVAEMSRSEEARAIVRSIVDIARHLGQQTVAEGVEDQDTLDTLRGYGVDHAQGFHIGRPRPLGELAGATPSG